VAVLAVEVVELVHAVIVAVVNNAVINDETTNKKLSPSPKNFLFIYTLSFLFR
jgi:hypothetical protein